MTRFKFSAPLFAIFIVISGIGVGAVLRSKQKTAPVNPSIASPLLASPLLASPLLENQGSGSPSPASRVAKAVAPLEHPYTIPIRNDDIDETVEAPSLAVGKSGTVYMAWASKTNDGEHALMMSRSETAGKTWIEPWQVTTSPIHVAVSEMRGRRIERRVRLMPHIATHEERLYLSWVRGGEERSDVAMLLATSDDQGRTFSEPVRVHESDQARPTFTSLAVSRNGDVACSWLDNRNDVQQCFMAVKPYDQEKFLPEMLVDAGQDQKGICPCCPTAVSFAPDQSVWVAYRGHVEGMRDMWTARWQPGSAKPSAPMRTNVPTWKFDGCPHDGPTLIPMQNKTIIAWMDAHQGMSRVFVNQLTAATENSASDWTHALATPLDATFAGTQEQPCLVADSSSSMIHAAWSATDSRRAIHFASSFDGGKTFSPSLAIAPVDDAFQSRVKLAVAPEGHVYAAYFELSSEGKRLVVGRIQPFTQATTREGSIAGVTP